MQNLVLFSLSILMCVLISISPALSTPIVVRIGVYENVPKITVDRAGKPSGILGDLIVEIARLERWQLEVVPCEWEQCMELVRTGQIDLLPDVAENEQRRTEMEFHAIPVLHSWSQVYRSEKVSITTILELDQKRIAILEDSIQLSYLRGLAHEFDIRPDFVVVPTLERALQAVADGNADAMVTNHLHGHYNAPTFHLFPTPVMFLPSRLFYATPPRQGDVLRAQIDAHLARWRDNPDSMYYQILRRWGGETQPQPIPKALWWGLGILSALLAVTVAFIYLLRYQVRQKTRELAESDERLSTILNHLDAYVYIKDSHHCYQFVSQKVCEVFGLSAEQIIGRRDDSLFDSETAARLYENDSRVLKKGEKLVIEETNHFPLQSITRTYLSVKIPLWDARGSVVALCGISTDITEQRRHQEELHQLTFYDPLTALPNRRLFLDRLRDGVANITSYAHDMAIVYIDLDHFRDLNDTLGHQVGDRLLQIIATRLQAVVQQGDTMARLGGDEFVLLKDNLSANREKALQQVEHVIALIVEQLSGMIVLEHASYTVTASIGAAFLSDTGRGDELLKSAELAMFEAKESGRNAVRYFDPSMQKQANMRIEMEAGLRRGLLENEFILYYQPQYTAQGAMLGVEALVRWQPPGKPLTSPAEFIPIAESSGLILPLGRWILRTACGQLARWAQQPETAHWRVAVNVSARQLHDPEFVADVLNVLEQTGADPHLLELELTESLLVENVEQTIIKILALRERGVSFSLDDFGTGYSSLNLLKRLPLDQLKIDQSFVRDLLSEKNDEAIIRTIITLGRNLNLQVIAEGVETEAQRDALLAMGCDRFQGYLFSRPLPEMELLQQIFAVK
ncbi:EAL domain-containing protein [Chrysiogenes arsenatis]|uniref:EAL domain-containing protein n=1 Tax=Chrysiogenes arsenatis TaxID=309797 RepID=UPI0003F6E1F5|nr:EAL domain-containing protein [Chrysiogenes arsenatis]